MNRLSLLRIAVALTLIAFVAGCKSSKSNSSAKTESTAANPVDVTSTVNAEPVAIHVHSTETAEPFPPNPTPGPADAELSYRTHRVKKGDTFYGIAKQYGVSAKDVINANPGVEPTRIRIGQEIIVPFARK